MGSFLNFSALVLATGFGAGFLNLRTLFKKLPIPSRWTGAGLWGTLLGAGFVLLGFPLHGPKAGMALGLTTLLAYFSADRAEKIFKIKDDSRIICDEIIGFIYCVCFLPPVIDRRTWGWVLIAAILLFRLLDVCKWPFKNIQNIEGGWGILLDDLFAGLGVNLLLQIVLRIH